MTKSSCDITDAIGMEPKPEPVPGPVDKIPPEKLKAMQDRARQIKRKYPQMKTNRIMRKVAEEFKIKLV